MTTRATGPTMPISEWMTPATDSGRMLFAEAASRVASFDAIDRGSGFCAPVECGAAVVDAAMSALVAALDTQDIGLAADALIMLRQWQTGGGTRAY